MTEWASRRFANVYACGLIASVGLSACTWTPDVRPVEPRLIQAGPHYVIDHEEVAGQDYVLIVSDYLERIRDEVAAQLEDEGEPPDIQLEDLGPSELRDLLSGMQRDILDVNNEQACRVPGFVFRYFYQRNDPNGTRVDAWRVAFRRRDDEGYWLEFMDERCREKGPRLQTWSSPSPFRDPETRKHLALVRDQSDVLWWLDPWSERNNKRRVAEQVLDWRFVAAPPNDQLDDDEQGVLLLEGERPEAAAEDEEAPPLRGELVVRRLDGEAIARFGEDVESDFAQTRFGGLRVAYVSHGVLYEVVAPDLEPVRLTPRDGEACAPRYTGSKLEFDFPCDTRRINRIDLATGELDRLESDIADEWSERGWSFELRYTGPRDQDTGERPTGLFAQAPGEADFVRVEPALTSLRAIDATRLLGIAASDAEYGDLGTWSEEAGFESVLERVGYYYTFEDTRYTADRDEPVYLWVVHHDLRDDVGEISLLSSRNLSIELVARGVPLGGFRQYTFTAVLNPAVVVLRDLDADGGVLEARMIPDLIGTRVDEGVIGFTSRSSHQEPGLYYSVGPGEREGIWFAPL